MAAAQRNVKIYICIYIFGSVGEVPDLTTQIYEVCRRVWSLPGPLPKKGRKVSAWLVVSVGGCKLKQKNVQTGEKCGDLDDESKLLVPDWHIFKQHRSLL